MVSHLIPTRHGYSVCDSATSCLSAINLAIEPQLKNLYETIGRATSVGDPHAQLIALRYPGFST
jgi:hypothetical protein